MSNAMQDALAKAGITTAEERLMDIAIAAMVAHAEDTEATMQAIWDAVQKDRGLLIELFRHAWRNEIRALLNRTRTEISYKEHQGKITRPVDRKAAKLVSLMREQEKARERAAAAAERAAQAQRDQEYAEYLASWRATPIGTLEIDGVPVWDCTPATVRAWLPTQRRRWRTVELLIEGLPDDGRPIAYYRRPAEVADLWQRAQ